MSFLRVVQRVATVIVLLTCLSMMHGQVVHALWCEETSESAERDGHDARTPRELSSKSAKSAAVSSKHAGHATDAQLDAPFSDSDRTPDLALEDADDDEQNDEECVTGSASITLHGAPELKLLAPCSAAPRSFDRSQTLERPPRA